MSLDVCGSQRVVVPTVGRPFAPLNGLTAGRPPTYPARDGRRAVVGRLQEEGRVAIDLAERVRRRPAPS